MKTPATHPREEEAAAYVFGHMEGAERIAFARDLEHDAVLCQVTEELSDMAGALALTARQSAPPALVRDWVVDRVKTIPQDGRAKPVTTAAPRGRGFAFLGWAAAAALAIVGGVAWMQVDADRQALVAKAAALEKSAAEVRAQNTSLKTTVSEAREAAERSAKAADALKQELTDKEKAASALKQELATATDANKALEQEKALIIKSQELDKMQIATLKSTIADYKQGVAVVVWDAAKQEGILKLERMPPVQQNKDYQLWVVDPSKKTPVNAGVVRVDAKGFAKVQFKPALDVQSADKFALSVEKKVPDPAGVPVGAGPIVLLSP